MTCTAPSTETYKATRWITIWPSTRTDRQFVLCWVQVPSIFFTFVPFLFDPARMWSNYQWQCSRNITTLTRRISILTIFVVFGTRKKAIRNNFQCLFLVLWLIFDNHARKWICDTMIRCLLHWSFRLRLRIVLTRQRWASIGNQVRTDNATWTHFACIWTGSTKILRWQRSAAIGMAVIYDTLSGTAKIH